MREKCTMIVLVLIALVFGLLSLVSLWLAWGVSLVLAIMFVANALQKIPAQPPSKAILTLFGKRQEVVLNEGWNLFPLYPFVFGFILVKVEKVNYDLEPQEVRTPDRAEISISASITWIPGIKDRPDSYINYLNSGGEEGVKKIIHDVIEDRTKTWAGSNKEGPSTWMEAQAMKDDAHEVLLKSLLGDVLSTIPEKFQTVPTSTWMRFLDKPKSEPTKYDANPRNHWASKSVDADGNVDWDWSGLQAIFDGYSADEKKALADSIDARRVAVRKTREGKGDFGDESLGITIVRFTVNEVKVLGSVAKAAELEEKERREKEADKMEIDNISDRAAKLRSAHPDLTADQAFQIVQTERGKVNKTIVAVSGASTGLGQDILGGLGLQRMPSASGNPGNNPGKNPGGGQKTKRPEDMDENELREWARSKTDKNKGD